MFATLMSLGLLLFSAAPAGARVFDSEHPHDASGNPPNRCGVASIVQDGTNEVPRYPRGALDPVADALLARGRAGGKEILLLTRPDGTLLLEEEGTEASVSTTSRIATASAGQRGLAAIHNHPRSLPVSLSDIALLTNPAVDITIALAHDGATFAVTRGPRFDARQLDSAFRAITLRFGRDFVEAADRPGLRPLPPHVALFLITHGTNLLLHDMEIIRYTYALSETRAAMLQSVRWFSSVVQRAAAELQRTHRESAPAVPTCALAGRRAGSRP